MENWEEELKMFDALHPIPREKDLCSVQELDTCIGCMECTIDEWPQAA